MRNTRNAIRNTRCAFSLVELMIVVAVIGILAAMALPTFQNHITRAKEAAARDNLRILREAIQRYATNHNDIPPGYSNDDTSKPPIYFFVQAQLKVNEQYLSEIPENPFNGQCLMQVLNNNAEFPPEPVQTETYGWIYQPATKTIKLNWSGTDSEGKAYYDY